jgi:hypothetical protein
VPGFSGDRPGDRILAPAAPDTADQPGYSNAAADDGNPHHRAAAFRRTVQANLARAGKSA